MTNSERAHQLAMFVASAAAQKNNDPVKAYLAAFSAVLSEGAVSAPKPA